nr:MAG TPA: hypothetical protein [Caudoviricetes sp.]
MRRLTIRRHSSNVDALRLQSRLNYITSLNT